MRGLALAALALTLAACAGTGTTPAAGPAPAATRGEYAVYVVSESADEASRVEFGPGGARVAGKRPISAMPVEVDGPHGVAVSPDGRFYYVTVAHGTPFGSLWKLSTATDSVVTRLTLGRFPATIDLTPDGEYAFISNFNLHGDPVPSSVSKVHLPSMTEVARTETCVMPHGSRVNRAGTKQYSVCMMDDELVEIDVASGEVSQRVSVRPGMEGLLRPGAASGMAAMKHDAAGAKVCSPTWAQPSPDGRFVYVACNKAAEVLEVETGGWTVTRRFATGANPYNLDLTPDGTLLLATLKNRDAPALEVIDLATGQSRGRVATTDVLPHGIAVSRDGRYAFVSVEGVGSAPGRVDVVDLGEMRRVDSVEVGPQAGGIALAR